MSKWPQLPLGEFCTISGGNAAPQDPSCFNGGDIPFVRMKDLGREHFTSNLVHTDDHLTSSAVSSLRLRIYEPGCLLFPRSGSVFLNHRAILGTRACIVSHIGVLSNLANSIDGRFLYYYLTTVDMKRLSKKTTGVDSIAFSDVARIPIPVPPMDKQRRIAAILDAADELRRLRAEADRRTTNLIPALFHEMFGDLPGLPMYRAADVCEFITKGTTPPASEIADVPGDGDIPFLKVYHIGDEGAVDFGMAPSFVSKRLHEGLLSRSKVYPGDVLMNIVGPPLGRIGLVPDTFAEYNINQALAIFRPKRCLIPTFLFHAIRSRKILDSILRRAHGVRQLNLTLEDCRNIELPVPPLSEQEHFVHVAEKIDAMSGVQAQSRGRLDDLFQALLHRAFAGNL